jgi:hypothetical protein
MTSPQAVPDLLPCPFCGNSKNIAMANEKHDHSGGYFIACPVCDGSTGLQYAMGDDPRPLLIEQWNRRATPPAGIEAMREALQNHRSLYFCDEDGGLPLVDLIAHALGDKDISRALLEIGAIADAIWLENSPANAAHPAPAETENEKVMRDLLTTGTAIMFDGKRMDPCDVFEPAPADHIADGGKKVSVAAIPDGVKFDPEALNRWADAVCPFTRTQAPDNLTLSCIATLLRDLSAAPTPKEPG